MPNPCPPLQTPSQDFKNFRPRILIAWINKQRRQSVTAFSKHTKVICFLTSYNFLCIQSVAFFLPQIYQTSYMNVAIKKEMISKNHVTQTSFHVAQALMGTLLFSVESPQRIAEELFLPQS